MAVLKVCLICGSDFKVPPCRAESAKTCSKACKVKLWSKVSTEAKPQKTCSICGKLFQYFPSHEDRRQCCSQECANKSRAIASYRPGSKNHNWKGGTTVHANGYLYVHIDTHPFHSSNKYVFEHRLVAEEWMREVSPNHKFLVEINGVKYLKQGIEVHHINENKRDNFTKNLLVCTAGAHASIHNGVLPSAEDVWPGLDSLRL
jgi:hypothetical protein